MSNYVQSTNFATKDSLSPGDPLKIVKGTEINTEFVNIAVAVATKADTASPTFTGTPTLPTGTIAVTQSAGNNTTAIATTAFVQAATTALGLGTMATQNASAVAITGGTITGTTVNSNTVGSNSVGARTVSTSSPTGGSDGDIWYKV